MRSYDEEVIMETLLRSPLFQRFILEVIRQRGNPLRNKSEEGGLMTFDARDCEKVGIL